MSLVLGFPVDFFISGRSLAQADPGSAHFRSLRSASQLERKAALAHAGLTWDVVQVLQKFVQLPHLDLPDISLSEGPASEEVESVALDVRRYWGLPPGPVSHMVRQLESRGIVVTRLPDELERVDAFSAWFEGRPIVMLSPNKNDAARSRFDAAHELGHLIMHHDAEPGQTSAETEAHLFAATFLMPASEIRPHLPSRADWQRLLLMKRTWGVSLSALLFRARKLGVMSDPVYRRAMSTMSKEGWRKSEPGELGDPEAPSLFSSALSLMKTQALSIQDIEAETKLPMDTLQHLLALGGDSRPPVNLQEPSLG